MLYPHKRNPRKKKKINKKSRWLARCFIGLHWSRNEKICSLFFFSLYLVKEFVATGGIFKSLAGVVQSVTELGQLSLQRRGKVEDAAVTVVVAAAAGSCTPNARVGFGDRRLFVSRLSGSQGGRRGSDAGIPLQVFQQFLAFDDLFLGCPTRRKIFIFKNKMPHIWVYILVNAFNLSLFFLLLFKWGRWRDAIKYDPSH